MSEIWARENPGVGLPYKLSSDGKTKVLKDIVLRGHNAIFECNGGCNCSHTCMTRLVQYGRTLPLAIFRTEDDRGFGVRCSQDIRKGQFIDTYSGEVITLADSEARERAAVRLYGERAHLEHSVYTFSLDKFDDDNGDNEYLLENRYVIDGQYYGGPTRFINHSCMPNVKNMCVSFNNYDPSFYHLAFFALRDIPAGEELTWDYTGICDYEQRQPVSQKLAKARGGRGECKCHTDKCRYWIFPSS
ncbi:MAG: hypothetical protein M1824_001271 [Vezdaea acicularis]|nr:MAG: hypothetical protein M1824_001271 [Vezdaea acicularis]